MTLKVWKQILRLFISTTKSYFNGQTGIMILDRLASHINASMLSLLFKSNFRTLLLPVKSSHFLQPLDNLCFGKWKSAFRSVMSRVDLVPTNNNRPEVQLEELVIATEPM